MKIFLILWFFESCSLWKECIDEYHLTSWDLEVWATNPPPWKWMTRQGDEGSRLVLSPSDKEMAPPSARQRDSRVSLSWRKRVTQWINTMRKIADFTTTNLAFSNSLKEIFLKKDIINQGMEQNYSVLQRTKRSGANHLNSKYKLQFPFMKLQWVTCDENNNLSTCPSRKSYEMSLIRTGAVPMWDEGGAIVTDPLWLPARGRSKATGGTERTRFTLTWVDVILARLWMMRDNGEKQRILREWRKSYRPNHVTGEKKKWDE